MAEVLKECVSEASPLSWQIWEELVQSRIIEELEVFWKSVAAKQGYSLEEVAR